MSIEPLSRYQSEAGGLFAFAADSHPEGYMDSAANGNILKAAYKKVVEEVKRRFGANVVGVTGSSTPITHVGVSEALGMVHIVPGATENLISIPVLMRQGCTLAAKGRVMKVFDPGGRTKLVANMNEKGMYVVKLNSIAVNSKGKQDIDAMMRELRSMLVSGMETADHPIVLGKPKEGLKAMLESGDQIFMCRRSTRVKSSAGENFVLQGPTPDSVYACLGELNDQVTTLTAEERERAKRARQAHSRQGHPSDPVLILALDNGLYEDAAGLTGKDLINSSLMYGPCEICAEAKMTAPIEPTSDHVPADKVGQSLFIDLHSIPKDQVSSIGGHRQWLVGIDEKSGMPFQNGLISKTQRSVCSGLDTIIVSFNQYSHRVEFITFDNEAVFVSCGDYLRGRGITPIYMPSGLHNKRAERLVRQLKDKMRAIECAIPFEIPLELHGELLDAAVGAIADLPCGASGDNATPRQLVSGKRPSLKKFAWGQPGLCHSRRTDDANLRAEWCIYLGGSGARDVRVYIPQRKAVYSRRRFMEMDGYPQDWNYKRRIRIIATRSERQMEKLQDVMPMTTAVANTVVQEQTRELDREDDNAVEGVAPQHGVDTPAAEQARRIVIGRPEPQAGATELAAQADNDHADIEGVETEAVDDSIELELASSAKPVVDLSSRFEPAFTRSKGRSNISALMADAAWNDPDDPNLRAYMTNVVRDRLVSADFTSDEADAYAEGLVGHIPMHDAENWIDELMCFRITLQEAVKERDPVKLEMINKALDDEIDNLVLKNRAVRPVRVSSLTRQELDRRVPGHTFLKFKELATGAFDKVKARTVIGGNLIDRETVQETNAPTIGIVSVMGMLSMAVAIGFAIWTTDIQGAFLIPDLAPGSVKRHMLMDRIMSMRYVEKYPEFAGYLDSNGRLTLELLKYLYGLPEAAYQFWLYMTKWFKSHGYHPTVEDKCVFIGGAGSHRTWIGLLVDDLLLMGKPADLKYIEDMLDRDFKVKVDKNRRLSYIGLDLWKQDNGDMLVGQGGCTIRVIERFKHLTVGMKRKVTTVGCHEAFDRSVIRDGEDEPLNDRLKGVFLSAVMSLMFISRLTRYDMLFFNVFLATRCKDANKVDMMDLIRLLKYLEDSGVWVLRFKFKAKIRVLIWADASDRTHRDGHGQYGLAFSFGSAVFHCRSVKIKQQTRSSTESEWVSVSEASAYRVWLVSFMTTLGFKPEKRPRPVIYQDNLSAIWQAREDFSFARNKHMLVHRNYVKEGIDADKQMIIHCDTEKMPSDMLTKVVSGVVMRRHMATMGMEKQVLV